MTEYKEIQEQTYLNLDNGNVYFAVEAVLRILNNRTEENQPNSISPTRLDKLMRNNNVSWRNINRKQVRLIITYRPPKPDDEHTASLDKIKVVSNEDLAKLIDSVRSMKPTKNSQTKKYSYIEHAWGLIEEANDKEVIPPLYYSITRTVHEIQGHQAYGHVSATQTAISERTLIKKAKDFVNSDPQKFKIIKLSPSDICFGDSRIHSNSIEAYVNLSLHDELLNHYKTRKGVHIKKEMASLEDIISSKEPVIKYIRKNLSNQIEGNSDAFHVKLMDYDIRAIDKSITRQYKSIEDYVRKRFSQYENEIINLRNSNARYIAMRGKLKNYLEYEYNSKEVSKLFIDKTAHHIIGVKLREIFNL